MIAAAGDVNGDGFGDVIVGDPYYTNGETEEGRAIVFHGSPAGLSASPDWMAESDQSGAEMGGVVAGAGDVNSDGYADVLVAANGYSNGQSDEGGVFVFLGSPAGLSLAPHRILESNESGSDYGTSIDTAGDVNGDGYSDIIIGAPLYDVDFPDEGAAFIYYGSAAGISAAPDEIYAAYYSDDHWGTRVRAAGDVNGDGFSDVLVTGSLAAIPTVRIFYGSPAGLTYGPYYEYLTQEFASGAGDFNGDGLADLAIADPVGGGGAVSLYLVDSLAHPAVRQARADCTAPVAVGGRSESTTSFRLQGEGRSPAGRTRLALEWEVKPLGVPFDGYGLVRGVWINSGAPVSGEGSRIDLHASATGLNPGSFYKWRVRIASESPFFPHSRWYALPDNGVTETDLRTAGCLDADGDGYGAPPDISCPNGGLGDCNDGEITQYPGNPELCDGLDNDCDWVVPDDELDADADGLATCAGDCDDTHAQVLPGFPEYCDGLDNDCDPLTTESCVTWAIALGDVDVRNTAEAIAATSDGGAVLAGRRGGFYNSIDNSDGWIVRLDAGGDIEWQRSYSGVGDDSLSSIAPTADGGFIAGGGSMSFGGTWYDLWVLKIDSGGNLEWQKRFSIDDDYLEQVRPTSDGGFIVVGNVIDDFGPADAWILRLDASGNILWQYIYGDAGVDWFEDVIETSDGGFLVIGNTSSFGLTGNDALLIKLDGAGTLDWQRTYEDQLNEMARRAIQLPWGGFAVLGTVDGAVPADSQVWLMITNSSGVPRRSVSVSTQVHTEMHGLVATPEGGFIAAGTLGDSSANQADAWAVKLRPDLSIEWQRSYGGVANDGASGVALSPSGEILLAGQTASFGPSSTQYDAWVVRPRQDGALEAPCASIVDTTFPATSSSLTDGVPPFLPQPPLSLSSDTGARQVSTMVMVEPLCAGGSCVDADGDGYGAPPDPSCPGGPETDCDPADTNTYPGAPEVHDGVDNQCPGDEGEGVIDEVTGGLGQRDGSGPDSFCWDEQPGATRYEVIRSVDPSFSSACVSYTTAALCWEDPSQPPGGQAFNYLARVVEPTFGSWGSGSSGERTALCGQELACRNGGDDDGDSLSDCDDPDCYADALCRTATFSFTDTAGDDQGPLALVSFFSTFEFDVDDYLYYSITSNNPSLKGSAWCADHSWSYIFTYVAWGGMSVPPADYWFGGFWTKWARIEGGTWSSPSTALTGNHIGGDCVGPFSWCPEEYLLVGGWQPILNPLSGTTCEARLGSNCGDETWTFTLKVGPERLETCGF